RHPRDAPGAGRGGGQARCHLPVRHHGHRRGGAGRAGASRAHGRRRPDRGRRRGAQPRPAGGLPRPAAPRAAAGRAAAPPPPSAVVVHVGSTQRYAKIAHHNIHFGRAWRSTFDEVIRRGRLMSDPSLLVTNPTRTDPTLAPDGREIYYVLAPAPNLDIGDLDW